MKGKSYIGHELVPLSNAKVPKGKPITKFVNNRFNHNFQQELLAMDNCIPSVRLF